MSDVVKLYKIKSFAYTPFQNEEDLEYLRANGIVLSDNILDADILISQNYKHLKKYFPYFIFKKKFLIWTLEPRFNTNFNSTQSYYGGLIKCHFMNIYTGDVFTSGLNFHAKNISKKLDYLTGNHSISNRKIVALMSHFKGLNSPALIKDGRDIDLIKIRTKIALEGYETGVVDIYGQGWPDGIVIENSRSGNWKHKKNKILRKYNFNLCFENTIAHNYITEKIWDSIDNYCLPIYYGCGNNVYKFFPENSFIDYSKFRNPDDLFNYIKKMSDLEYIDRMNKCILVYNNISAKGEEFVWKQRKFTLDKLIEKIHLIQ